MERKNIESSNINSIGYDKERSTLEIEFASGSLFQYYDVPESIYREISNSPSTGLYFHKNIKNKYKYSHLSNHAFREIELISYLERLLKSNADFSNVFLEPKFSNSQNVIMRPDFICDYLNQKLIIEVKRSAPFTENRVLDYIKQLKRYQNINEKAQLVICFPEEIHQKYVDTFIRENIIIWDISKLASIFYKQIDLVRDTPIYPKLFNASLKSKTESQASKFIKELKSMKAGKSYWSEYQKLIFNVLEFLFSPPLSKPIYELSDKSKVNRRDIILPNYSENGFWKFLRDNYLAHYIVIDSKNLSKNVTKKDVLQVSNYLKKFGTGLFGIIISRNKPHSNAIHTQREHWISENKLIIFLQDDDLVQMLILKENSGIPEDVLRQKIEDFRLSL